MTEPVEYPIEFTNGKWLYYGPEGVKEQPACLGYMWERVGVPYLEKERAKPPCLDCLPFHGVCREMMVRETFGPDFQALKKDLGRNPTAEEMSEYIEINVKAVAVLMEDYRKIAPREFLAVVPKADEATVDWIQPEPEQVQEPAEPEEESLEQAEVSTMEDEAEVDEASPPVVADKPKKKRPPAKKHLAAPVPKVEEPVTVAAEEPAPEGLTEMATKKTAKKTATKKAPAKKTTTVVAKTTKAAKRNPPKAGSAKSAKDSASTKKRTKSAPTAKAQDDQWEAEAPKAWGQHTYAQRMKRNQQQNKILAQLTPGMRIRVLRDNRELEFRVRKDGYLFNEALYPTVYALTKEAQGLTPYKKKDGRVVFMLKMNPVKYWRLDKKFA